MSFIFATGNDHKVLEARSVLALPFKSLKEINFNEEIAETGSTLEENALIKARHIYNLNPNYSHVFSEDTGLEVNALNGAPGVITARYAGTSKSFTDNMDLLLYNLKEHEDRAARFRAVIALIIEGTECIFEGIINGTIAKEKYGDGGFGYDPIFVPEGYSKTFAELGNGVKSQLSHRSRALQKMKDHLDRLDIKI